MSVPFDLIFAGTSAAIVLLLPVADEAVVVPAVFVAELFVPPPPQPVAATMRRRAPAQMRVARRTGISFRYVSPRYVFLTSSFARSDAASSASATRPVSST